jgi:pimeloyl-ACP methyl ester carboxylesterase
MPMARLLPLPLAPAGIWQARNVDHGYGQGAEPDWRDVDWLAHRHQIELGGRQVNYVDIGSGDATPVVFVHGLGGQWQNWLENIPRAATERRAIAVDLPGFGLSELPREKVTIPGYGRFVSTLLDRLGLERAHLVGNSMGGLVCSEVAIQFPDLVERLVLVSAAGISTASVLKAPVVTLARAAAAVTAFTAARHRDIASRRLTRHAALALVARYPSLLKADVAWEALMKGTGKPGFDDALLASLGYDYRERLPEIRHPTLIVWGEQDSILPVEDAHEYERLIEDSRKVVMENTGHVPMVERPAAFNDTLMEFLAETAPAKDREAADHESESV